MSRSSEMGAQEPWPQESADRISVAELAAEALDEVDAEHGEESRIVGAVLVLEVVDDGQHYFEVHSTSKSLSEQQGLLTAAYQRNQQRIGGRQR